jgi:mono/diheme cytochrome c family protein
MSGIRDRPASGGQKRRHRKQKRTGIAACRRLNFFEFKFARRGGIQQPSGSMAGRDNSRSAAWLPVHTRFDRYWFCLMEMTYRTWMCSLIIVFPLLSFVTNSTTPSPQGDMSRGADAEVLYLRYCARCHGRTGRRNGPSDRHLRAPLHSFTDCGWMSMMSDATLFLIIKDGSSAAGFPSGMPAYGMRLNQDEIEQLVEYVRKFCLEK